MENFKKILLWLFFIPSGIIGMYLIKILSIVIIKIQINFLISKGIINNFGLIYNLYINALNLFLEGLSIFILIYIVYKLAPKYKATISSILLGIFIGLSIFSLLVYNKNIYDNFLILSGIFGGIISLFYCIYKEKNRIKKYNYSQIFVWKELREIFLKLIKEKDFEKIISINQENGKFYLNDLKGEDLIHYNLIVGVAYQENGDLYKADNYFENYLQLVNVETIEKLLNSEGKNIFKNTSEYHKKFFLLLTELHYLGISYKLPNID